MGNLLWSSDRPEFCERIAKLAGGTTFREPWAASGGDTSDKLPDAHAIATALAFARRGPQDIGPDVAYCLVLKSDTYKGKVSRKVMESSIPHNKRTTATVDVFLKGFVCAWNTLIYEKPDKRPHYIGLPEWEATVNFCLNLLYSSAWDSLSTAEKSYRNKA